MVGHCTGCIQFPPPEPQSVKHAAGATSIHLMLMMLTHRNDQGSWVAAQAVSDFLQTVQPAVHAAHPTSIHLDDGNFKDGGLLHRLYQTSYKTPSQLYMLLIIILILTQDKGFCQNIQEVTLPSVSWYKERLLQKTTLGNCLLLMPFCILARRRDAASCIGNHAVN